MRGATCFLLQFLSLSSGAFERALAARGRDDQHAILLPGPVLNAPSSPDLAQDHDFTLRHVYHHGSHDYPELHRYIDIRPDSALVEVREDGTALASVESVHARSRGLDIQRMLDRSHATVDRLLESGRLRGEAASLPPSAWTIDHVLGPNVTDKETVLSFAKMAANAYVTAPGQGEWVDVGSGFNYTEDFGWENDGLRGHIFADTKNKTVVIGLKGTSPAVWDGTDTTGNDKLNDNLFGSCCCAQGGQYLWRQVCDCQTSTYTCNSTCLVKSLREKSHYYWAAKDLYHNVTERYPGADVWLTGHSLGGVVTALLGLTFGLPTLTFETFPDALAASRLGLPTPPGYQIGSHQERVSTGIYHFGHTADPIYMGTCNAASSFCTIGGYAFQSQCHTGRTCTYDTVGDLGWRPGVGNHKINNVIKGVISKYDIVPSCEQDTDCVDCYAWKFYESNGTETTSSSSSTSTSTRTRTATCKSPGWWGCLDESTTTTIITPTTTFTSTYTTCESPGWFGCKDPTTNVVTTTVTSPAVSPAPTITTTSSTSSLPTITTSSSTSASTAYSTTYVPTTSSTTCTSKEWFGLVCVDPSPDPSSSASRPSLTPTSMPGLPGMPSTRRKHCNARHWWGGCIEWESAGQVAKADV